MEPNIEQKKYVILIINNVKGNISRLNLILQKISSQKEIDFKNFNLNIFN